MAGNLAKPPASTNGVLTRKNEFGRKFGRRIRQEKQEVTKITPAYFFFISVDLTPFFFFRQEKQEEQEEFRTFLENTSKKKKKKPRLRPCDFSPCLK